MLRAHHVTLTVFWTSLKMWSVIGKEGWAVERTYTVKKLSRGRKVRKKDQQITQNTRAGSQSPSQPKKWAREPSHLYENLDLRQEDELLGQESSNSKRPRKGKVVELILINFDVLWHSADTEWFPSRMEGQCMQSASLWDNGAWGTSWKSGLHALS